MSPLVIICRMSDINFKLHFGHALKALRVRAKLTQEALAEASGSQANYISMLESGKRQPSISKMFELARGLGVAPTELVEWVQASIDGEIDTEPRIKRHTKS